MARLKKTILCVGDNWDELVARRMLLETVGYRVLPATDADEGLRFFRSNAIDAVILDYHVPGMKVEAVTAKMKGAKPHVPIVLLSSFWPLPKNKLIAIDKFLTKAQESEMLLPIIEELFTIRTKPVFFQWLETWRSRNRTVLP